MNYAKNAMRAQTKQSVALKDFLVVSGEQYHRLHFRVQKLFLTTTIAEEYVKPLTEEKAIEAGAEFLGEVLAYGTLLLWGLYEMDRTQRDSKTKEDELMVIVTSIKEKMQDISAGYSTLTAELDRAEGLREELEKEKREEAASEGKSAGIGDK